MRLRELSTFVFGSFHFLKNSFYFPFGFKGNLSLLEIGCFIVSRGRKSKRRFLMLLAVPGELRAPGLLLCQAEGG